MELKDCQMLKIIARERNVTRAAERLYTSQPALTYRLKNLEKELDTEIVLRTSTGVILTPSGELLLSYAEEALARFTEVCDRLQNMGSTVRGTLRLGASAVIAHYELPAILKNFLAIYPDVGISITTGMSQKIHQRLQKDEISIAIIRGDFPWNEEKYLIRNEPVCLVASQPIALKDLPSHPRIVAQTDSPLQAMCEEWWRQTFKVSPKIAMELDSMETCRQMVLHGLGWAILPSIGIVQHKDLYIKPLYWANGEPLHRATWLLCSNDALQLAVVRSFIDYIKCLNHPPCPQGRK